jgi:hypothetical protein
VSHLSLSLAEARLLRRLAGRSQKEFSDCDASALQRRGLATLDPTKRLLVITEHGERLMHQARRDSGRI